MAGPSSDGARPSATAGPAPVMPPSAPADVPSTPPSASSATSSSPASSAPADRRRPPAGPPPRRGFFAVRWRQFRNAPRPVFRAVMSSLTVAVVLGVAFQAYDLALDRGARLPGGDLRLLALTGYVVAVLLVGSFVTWLVVPLPTGAGTTRRTRTPWSLALGLFAAVPIAYLVLVVLHEILKPFLI